MWSRERRFDISMLDRSLQEYLAFNPSLVKRRKQYALIKVLDFMRNDLGLKSIDELLSVDIKTLITSLQRWINKRAQETSIKTVRYDVYLVRSYFSYFDIEIPLKKLKIPRKGAKSRVDRIPSVAELQRLVMGTKSPRMRLAIMMLALTGMRLNECLSVRREHIDLNRGVITIPPENTKTGVGREVPTPSELKEELVRFFKEHFPYEKGFVFCVEGNPEKKVPVNRFYEVYIELLKRLGLDQKTPDGSAYVLHPHVFRKWYRTQLESAGVNKLLIDLWLGHNSGVEKVYYLPTPEIVQKEFEKADKALRIFGSVVQTAGEKLEALEEAVKFYETLFQHLQKKNPKLLRELGLE